MPQSFKTSLFKQKHPSWMLFVVLGLAVIAVLVFVIDGRPLATQVGVPQPSSSAQEPWLQEQEQAVEYVSNELLIKIKTPQHRKIKKDPKPEDTGLVSLNELDKEHGVIKFGQISKPSKKSKNPDHDVFRWYKVTLPWQSEIIEEPVGGTSQEEIRNDPKKEQLSVKIERLKSVLGEYKKNPDIEDATFNYLARTFVTPNDPLYPQQWSHQKAQAGLGWDTETGDPSTVVAIVDTGVYYNHEDLTNNIWRDNEGNPGKDFVDIDTAAYQASGFQLVAGEDYTGWDNDPSDIFGHGTHVAGIAGAVADNNVGIAGVCPDCRIMAVRAGFSIVYPGYGETGLFEYDDIQNALIFAADNGARIINMSFGGSGGSPAMKNGVDYAYSQGVTLVAAAGNSNGSSKSYPAGYNNVIAVGATAGDDSKAYYSNYGWQWVDVAAPGGDSQKDSMIMSTVPVTGTLSNPSGYRSLQGTSMAAPYVAGLAGLVASHFPGLTADEIQLRIAGTTDDIGSSLPDLAGWFGSGRVNVFKALGEPARPNVIVDWLGVQDSGQWISQGWIAQGDTEEMSILLRNTWLDVTNVTATLSSDSPYVSITNGSSSFGNISQGQIVTGAEKYVFLVSDLAPVGETIRFQLDVRGDGYQRILSLAFTVRFPFQDGFPTVTSAYLNFAAAATITDLEGDGRKEAIFIDSANIYVLDYLGGNKPGWPQANPSSSVSGVGTSVPAVGDMDNDGKQEVVAISCPDNCKLIIWEADGTKMLSTTSYPVESSSFMSTPALVDLDSDGDLEVIFGIEKTLYAVHHTGEILNGSWPVNLDTILYINSPAVGDLDNDGALEIVVAGFANNTGGRNRVVALNNQGVEIWSKELSGGIMNSPALADVDGDGKLEIFLASNKGFLHAWHYDGSELFPPIELAKDLGLSFDKVYASVALGDLDGDGDLEIVVGDYDGRRIYVYHHDGTLLAGWPIQHFVRRSSPVLADLDGDGKQDIIIGGFGFGATKLSAWRYDGSAVEGFPIDLRIIPSNTNWLLDFVPAIEDLDGDGDIELAMPIQASSYRLLVFDLPGSYNQSRMQWPTFHHDNQRTGRFSFDTDGDRFSDVVEDFVGTNPHLSCGVNAWPPDFNNDNLVNNSDVDLLQLHFATQTGDADYDQRYDLNADGTINLGDVYILRTYFGGTCSDWDSDGYTNTAESFMGTDPLLACGVNAWPPDFNDDSVVHIDDVAFVAARFGAREGDPSYTKRAELASQDGVIQIDDVSKIAGAFGTSCNAP